MKLKRRRKATESVNLRKTSSNCEHNQLYEKICILICKDPSNDAMCLCGREIMKHPSEARISDDRFWSSFQNTMQIPCKSFGRLRFTGKSKLHKASYIRVSDHTRIPHLISYALNVWDLENVNINFIVSVTGSDESIDSNVRSRLKRGLKKLIGSSAGVCILTDGLDNGIARIIGEIVEDLRRSKKFDMKNICIIGFLNWADVYPNRRIFEGSDNDFFSNSKSVYYEPDDNTSRCLEMNHTHFVFIDEGRITPSNASAGVVERLRTKFQTDLSEKGLHPNISGMNVHKTQTSVIKYDHVSRAIPAVSFIMNGDQSSLRIIVESLRTNIPCIVANNTGGAASIISDALKKNFMLRESKDSQQNSERIKLLNVCKQNARLITCLHNNDVDKCILDNLLNIDKKQSWMQQVIFAVRLQRNDVVESLLITHQDKIEQERLLHFEEFSQKVIDLCLQLFDFDQSELFRIVYEHLCQNIIDGRMILQIYSKLDYGLHSFSSLSTCIDNLMGSQYHSKFHYFSNKKLSQEDINNLLFTYCIISKNIQISQYFWRNGKNHIPKALYACRILKELYKTEPSLEIKNKISNIMSFYEERAYEIINQCWLSDEASACYLLDRPIRDFCNLTCIELGLIGDCKKFIDHVACQALFEIKWYHLPYEKLNMSYRWFYILVPRSLPLMSCSKSINYDEQNSTSTDVYLCNENRKKNIKKSFFCETCKSSNKIGYACPKRSFLGLPPASKYFYSLIAYLIFLGVFTYFVLIDFPENDFDSTQFINWRAAFVILYIFTSFVEEFRQILVSKGYFLKKIVTYFQDGWNFLDMVSLMTFVFSQVILYIAKFFINSESSGLLQELRHLAHIFLILSLTAFNIRLTHFFYASSNLGPKLVIIKRMLKDMIFFLLILIVFLLSFGVAMHATIHPHSTEGGAMLKDILLSPYWLMYGELENLLEEFSERENCSYNVTESFEYYNIPIICSFRYYFAICFVVLYLMLSNILLLNMLIAMFNFTFYQIHEQSDIYWKLRRFEVLLNEYQCKPSLPPPFIVLSHLKHLLVSIGECIFSIFHKENRSLDIAFNEYLDDFVKDTTLEMFDSEQSKELKSTELEGLERTLTLRLRKLEDKLSLILSKLSK